MTNEIKEVTEALEKIKHTFILVNDQILDTVTGQPLEIITSNNDHCFISVDNLRFSYPRIVFYLHTGIYPDAVEHFDGNTLNNHPSNLRVKNKTQAKKKLKGVSFHKNTGKWQAMIIFQGIKKHLGYFDTIEEAALYYDMYALHCFREYAELNDTVETVRIFKLAKEKMKNVSI